MFRHLNISEKGLAALERATAVLPVALAELDDLVARVIAAKSDRSRIHDAGLALEEIARRRLYRLARMPSIAALLASIGISRTTAYKWRVLARELDAASVAALGAEAAYHRARPRPDSEPRAEREARRVTERLRGLGIDAEATPVVRGSGSRLRVDLSAREWDRLLRAARPSTKSARSRATRRR